MSDLLSPERLAEIRRMVPTEVPVRDLSLVNIAMRELLAHIDAQQAEIDRLTVELIHEHAVAENQASAKEHWCRRADTLTEQVAALHALLTGENSLLAEGLDAAATAREHDWQMRLDGAKHIVKELKACSALVGGDARFADRLLVSMERVSNER